MPLGIWLGRQRIEVVGADDLFAVLLFLERIGRKVIWSWES